MIIKDNTYNTKNIYNALTLLFESSIYSQAIIKQH